MSKLIAFAAIQGGYKVVAQVEGELEKALQTYDASTKIGFPNTAYYLPVIYSLTGLKCETLEDLKKPMAFARNLLPPHIKLKHWLPYLGPLLDAGMAGILSYEVKEAICDTSMTRISTSPRKTRILKTANSGWVQPMTPSCENAGWSLWTVPHRALPPWWEPLPTKRLPR
jgi:hypothetical protein